MKKRYYEGADISVLWLEGVATIQLGNTTLEKLVTNTGESEYGHKANRLVLCCDDNNLRLNTSKTPEIIIQFRKKTQIGLVIIINGYPIERVNCVTFLT